MERLVLNLTGSCVIDFGAQGHLHDKLWVPLLEVLCQECSSHVNPILGQC